MLWLTLVFLALLKWGPLWGHDKFSLTILLNWSVGLLP